MNFEIHQCYLNSVKNHKITVFLTYIIIIYFKQQQKLAQNWMTKPAAMPGCPPGLEYLTTLDHLMIIQEVDLFNGS